MSKVREGLRKFVLAVGTGINVFCVGHCVFYYGAEFTFLTGPSMLPTFNRYGDTNVVITEKVSARWTGIHVGDVVIAKALTDPTNLVCKRVAATAGDHVRRPEGMFGLSPKKNFEIPRGHVWLLGDNPDNSTDSRSYGPVPLGLVHGKVCFKVWPLSEFGRISE